MRQGVAGGGLGPFLSALLLLGVSVPIFGACNLDVAPPKQVLWEASLEAVDDSATTLSGSAAAVAREDDTEVGVEVIGGQEGDRWVWRLRRGSCDSPGEPIGSAGAYPVLEAEDDPATPDPLPVATGRILLAESLLSDAAYFVRVAAEDSPDRTLLCGNLAVQ